MEAQISAEAAAMRREYLRDKLLETDVLPDPIAQFGQWFSDAQLAGVPEPNAMTVATATRDGVPSSRVVLLKGFDAQGFTFYTNYASRKARELDANPRASLCFYWQPLERQVRIDGAVERVSRAESDAYFHARPVASQVGAWVSQQSAVIATREQLDRRQAELAEKYRDAVVPLPDFWGGYRLVPTAIEFWQGRPSRLHDRLEFVRAAGAAGGAWTLRRLSP
ncbi:MAG TPA: pyridoxamine 5'-phosphate oxidase [Tepidisphaeraceae bacterium]|nr:pyridoxamine 5'-phosphate oxidase [Tepidisphaeraceae bacterium]